MIKQAHNIILFLAISLCLTACVQPSDPMGKPLPNITYHHLNPYTVNGGGVLVKESYTLSPETQKNNKEFVMAPDALLKHYTYSRFVTDKKPFNLIVDIRKADLSKTKKDAGALGFISGEDKDIYTLNLFMTLSFVKSSKVLSPYTIALDRKLALPHNISLAEKEFRQFEFLEKAMTDVDKAVTDIVVKSR